MWDGSELGDPCADDSDCSERAPSLRVCKQRPISGTAGGGANP